MSAFMPSNNTPYYPDSIDTELKAILKKSFVKNIQNPELNEHLTKNLGKFFDEIDQVSAQQDESFGSFYFIMGKKDGAEAYEMLKVNEEDIENNTYSYIDFSKFEIDENTTYCREGPPNPIHPQVCVGPCAKRTNNCLGLICGIETSLGCAIF